MYTIAVILVTGTETKEFKQYRFKEKFAFITKLIK